MIAFYLIKVHWELITRRWMRNPVAHADAWLAIFYLIYLLVRYRKTNKLRRSTSRLRIASRAASASSHRRCCGRRNAATCWKSCCASTPR